MAIEQDADGTSRDEQRKLLELSVKHSVAELWRFMGQPAKASFPVPWHGLIVTIEHVGGDSEVKQ